MSKILTWTTDTAGTVEIVTKSIDFIEMIYGLLDHE